MDETGWNVSGVRHWLCAVVNKRLAYYRIARRRGAKVPRQIPSEKYGGILVTDFYSAYNKLSGRKQRCLVHLEREMHQCFLRDQSEEYMKISQDPQAHCSRCSRTKSIAKEVFTHTLFKEGEFNQKTVASLGMPGA